MNTLDQLKLKIASLLVINFLNKLPYVTKFIFLFLVFLILLANYLFYYTLIENKLSYKEFIFVLAFNIFSIASLVLIERLLKSIVKELSEYVAREVKEIWMSLNYLRENETQLSMDEQIKDWQE